MDDHGECDIQKLRSFFNHRIVSEILKIKLSETSNNDTWIWIAEKSGNDNVKSAYQILQQNHQWSQGESSYEAELKPFGRKSVNYLSLPRLEYLLGDSVMLSYLLDKTYAKNLCK